MIRERKTFLTIVILAAFVFIIGGCTIAKISGRGPVPILLNNPRARVTVIEHFKESKMVVFDYTGSFDVSQVLGDVFTRTNADAVVNVVVNIKKTVGSWFVNLITLGIANAKTIQVEGDAVRAPEGLGLLESKGRVMAEAGSIDSISPSIIQKAGGACSVIRTVGEDGKIVYKLVQF